MRMLQMYMGMLCWLSQYRPMNTEGDYEYAREVMWNTYKGTFDREVIEDSLRAAWDVYIEALAREGDLL